MFICVRPRFDTATKYSWEWCQEIVDLLEREGKRYIDLSIADAVRSTVEAALKANPDAMLLHYDHGGEDCLYGNDAKPAIDLANNKLLKNRVSYNMNCSSAKRLGADSTLRYDTIYWGYMDVVSFTTDATNEFKEAFNYGFKLFLQIGGDWAVVLRLTKEKMTEIIDGLIKKGKVFAATHLRRDRDILVCYTPENPPEPPPPSDCPIRGALIFLFGLAAWKIPPHSLIPRIKAIVGIN